MKKIISIDRKFYDAINGVVKNNSKDQIMVVGGRTVNDNIVVDKSSLKWFTEKELLLKEDGSYTIEEGLLVRVIMDIGKTGHDSVFLIRSHHCENKLDDFLYGSLSSEDLGNSKKMFLICQFQNLQFFDAISTGSNIYFWSIDNEFLKPVQVLCSVDGEILRNKVPDTMQELVDVIRGEKNS